nr:family 10 glycosylhydrolase [uncultured Flavobacterium sp.]
MKSKIHLFIVLLLSLLNSNTSFSQCVTGNEFNKNTPKRDLRGVFVASVFNLNWPTNKTASPATQQAELRTILDNLKANGYNSVFLQVRSECDAMYSSAIEPWSQWLTGTQGLAPSPLWDPLSFAVTEAHTRGLELHAWLNPYRAQTSSVATYPKAANHVINTNPSWIFTSSTNANLKILDPGIPAVTTYITSIVQDIASRYNVDGIHFDDYFYPAGGMIASPSNQDAASYAAYNPGSLTLSDWRRDNVNKMIASVYDAIQTINTTNNKNIVFGVSPFGIWKSGAPAGITGQSSFNDLFCDPIAWLNAGKVDYLAPQLYWKITGGQDYIALSKWWNDQIKSKNKQLYVSQGYYKMEDSNNWNASEIQNQINQNRATTMDVTFGQIAYSYTSIKNNAKTINTTLNGAQFQYKSFAPPIAGKDSFCPEKPANIRFGALKIMWDTPAASPDDADLPEKYVVYAFNSAAEAITNMNDGSKIVDIVVGNELALTQSMIDTKFFVVSSLDKNNNEAGDFNTTLGNSDFNAIASTNLVVYPNPFVDSFTLDLKDASIEMMGISIFDATGKQVWQQNIEPNNASSSIISPSTLNSGIYYAKISFKNRASESFKIIKK